MNTPLPGRRPRLLDAFSCAGGAGHGYALAGFDVTGIDINDQPRYPHAFVQGDAIAYIREHGAEYDLIHASPPCQHRAAITKGTNRHRQHLHPDLYEPTRDALIATGRPWAIETTGIPRDRVSLTLCGEQFGLRVIRHRTFELHGLTVQQPAHVPHRGLTIGYRHGRYVSPEQGRYFQVYGAGGGKGSITDWQEAMGIDWTTDRRELAEAIPPAYTHWLGQHALATLLATAA